MRERERDEERYAHYLECGGKERLDFGVKKGQIGDAADDVRREGANPEMHVQEGDQPVLQSTKKHYFVFLEKKRDVQTLTSPITPV